MRRADRLFRLVQLLRSRRFATGQDLADALEVSKRTVYRDVADLMASGVPIRGEAGVGYRLERGYELPPLTFNTTEIEALVAGMRIVGAWADPELKEAAQSVLEKVDAVLPEPLRRVLGDTALFAMEQPWSAEAGEGLAVTRRAIQLRRCLELSYRRADGEVAQRVIRPLGIYFWGRNWTVAAWCELRDGYRNFRPDRMESVRLLDRTFEVGPDGITLDAFLIAMAKQDRRPPRADPAPPSR